MGDQGLEEVLNPSSMFLTSHDKPVSGTAIVAALDGTRPFLVEVQALAEDTPMPTPRRVASGFDLNRLQMLLAVLHKHGGVEAFNRNVYLKIVGGVRLTEPAGDLGALLAVHSSLTNQLLPERLVAFGEVGLAGEIRPVQDAETRLREASKLGFTKAIVPSGNKLKAAIPGMEIHAFSGISAVFGALRDLRD
jgi:DNA repair protein RadA/Sms